METTYLKCKTYEGESSNRDYLQIVSKNRVINTLWNNQLPLTEKGLKVQIIGEDDGKVLVLLPPGVGLERVINVSFDALAA